MDDLEEAAAELSAVNVDIAEFDSPPVGFRSKGGAKMLRKNSFPCSHIASYYDSLSHPLGATGDEAEELHQQTKLRFPVRKPLRNIVYVKL